MEHLKHRISKCVCGHELYWAELLIIPDWTLGAVWAWILSFPLGHCFALAGGGQQTCYSHDSLWSLLVDQAVRGVMKGIVQLKPILQQKDHWPQNCDSVVQGYSGFFHSKWNLVAIMKKWVVLHTTYTFFSTPKAKFINYVTSHLCVASETAYIIKMFNSWT